MANLQIDSFRLVRRIIASILHVFTIIQKTDHVSLVPIELSVTLNGEIKHLLSFVYGTSSFKR